MAEYYPPRPGVPYGYYQQPPPGAAFVASSFTAAAFHTPPFAPYSAHFPPYGSYDAVRTLFVAGFPDDVKAREIYNWFRKFPGYESSHLRNQAQASQGHLHFMSM